MSGGWKVRLQQRADEGDERARAALALAHDPNKFLSTVQFGITMVGVLAGAYGGATIAEQLAVPVATIPQLAPYAEAIALGLVVTAITILSLIIGELVPKRIALNNPEAIELAAAFARRVEALPGTPAERLAQAHEMAGNVCERFLSLVRNLSRDVEVLSSQLLGHLLAVVVVPGATNAHAPIDPDSRPTTPMMRPPPASSSVTGGAK